MSAFVEWNSLLLAQFFPPSAKNEEVWLHATRVELDSIGLRLGGAEGLIAAVQEGPPWLANYQNIAEAAVRLARQRKSKLLPQNYVDPGEVDDTYSGFSAPTYLPYLALWVLASSDASFYASVEAMSARSFPITSNSIREEMLFVWGDLEDWTLERNGEFGLFEVRKLGKHNFVGIPRSQCLISSKDKRGLPHLFLECSLRPGQGISPQIFEQVSSKAKGAHYLSNGLRVAFADPNYSEPLSHMLTAALRSWDGKAPRVRSAAIAGHAQHADSNDDSFDDDSVGDVTLVLRPGQSADWEIHWRIPVSPDERSFELTAGDGRWDAVLEEVGTHASTILPDNQVEAQRLQVEAKRLLALSGDSGVEFKVSYFEGDDENGRDTRKLWLTKRSFRTLAWDIPDPSRGNELVEGDVPLKGPCYILFAEDNESFLRRTLGSSQARWEPYNPSGLPEGWRLGCIHHCDLLLKDQRQAITESSVDDQDKARIRLVGGRQLVRGGGRTYAFYDLPIVELEAPDDASPAAEGFELTKLGADRLSGIDRPPAKALHGVPPPTSNGIRRYALRIIDERKALFHIRVVDAGNHTLAATTLKVSVAGGSGIAQGRNFGLGPLGQAITSGTRLLGVLREEAGGAISGAQPAKPFTTNLKNWKVLDGAGDLQKITESVPARFLDSLAQLGSIAYGTARDQLLRLAYQVNKAVRPALLLIELRDRGCLEIETDDEGHLIRVHAVPPTLYTLPLQNDGRAVRGVCGTLRLQHWKDLLDCIDGGAWLDEAKHMTLPALRLLPNSEVDFDTFVEMFGFTDARMPSSAIANWASGIDVARSTLSAWGWATLAAEIRHLQRFHPNNAEFLDQDEPRLKVDPQVMASLYRFEDPRIQGLRVYVLGVMRPDKQRQFSFLRDSRWGVWLALSAFADFAKREHDIGDASPWPIHYSDSDGTLLFPARLRPPFVIERVLQLCSASAPTQTMVEPDRVNRVYAEMSTGIWFEYRWVPVEIASKVAELLGATLAPLSY